MDKCKENGGYVRWSHVIPVFAGLVIALVSTGWGVTSYLLDQHAKHPHEGAVQRTEFDGMIRRLDRIENKIDRIEDKL